MRVPRPRVRAPVLSGSQCLAVALGTFHPLRAPLCGASPTLAISSPLLDAKVFNTVTPAQVGCPEAGHQLLRDRQCHIFLFAMAKV